MLLSRAAAVLAVAVPVLGAQQVARPAAQDAGSLVAEVHYTTGGDAWFTTNKPAYVALFDVSRGGVAQLYPTFTAQATQLSGTSVRVDMRSAAPLPSGGIYGGSSLAVLNSPPPATNAGAWPHTLLVVASTMPLRVGNSWTSNIAINNDLVRNHQWNDLDTDAGIAELVDLVRPQDWGAEVATDQAALATPAQYASSLSYDPNQVAVGFSCPSVTGGSYISRTPVPGAECIALRELPPSTHATVNASTVSPPGVRDTTRAVLQARSGPAAPRISEQHHGDVQSISDPAEIRKFMESMNAGQASHGSASGSAQARSGHPRRDGMPASDRSDAMNHPKANGASSHGSSSAGGASHVDQGHDAHPRVDEQPKPPPSSAPIKPANSHE